MQAQTIAVGTLKGGAHKTTTAVNLATLLAIAGKRVILADLDPQGQVALYFGFSPWSGVFGYLVQDKDLAAVSKVPAGFDSLSPGGMADLYVVGGDDKTRRVQTMYQNETDGFLSLVNMIRGWATDHGADYLILDTASSTFLQDAAITAASRLIIPCPTEALAVDGAMSMLAHAGKLNPQAAESAIILPSGHDESSEATAYLGDLRREYGAMVASPILRRVAVPKTVSEGKTVWTSAGRGLEIVRAGYYCLASRLGVTELAALDGILSFWQRYYSPNFAASTIAIRRQAADIAAYQDFRSNWAA
jgi:chromosome partitioning protein